MFFVNFFLCFLKEKFFFFFFNCRDNTNSLNLSQTKTKLKMRFTCFLAFRGTTINYLEVLSDIFLNFYRCVCMYTYVPRHMQCIFKQKWVYTMYKQHTVCFSELSTGHTYSHFCYKVTHAFLKITVLCKIAR